VSRTSRLSSTSASSSNTAVRTSCSRDRRIGEPKTTLRVDSGNFGGVASPARTAYGARGGGARSRLRVACACCVRRGVRPTNGSKRAAWGLRRHSAAQTSAIGAPSTRLVAQAQPQPRPLATPALVFAPEGESSKGLERPDVSHCRASGPPFKLGSHVAVFLGASDSPQWSVSCPDAGSSRVAERWVRNGDTTHWVGDSRRDPELRRRQRVGEARALGFGRQRSAGGAELRLRLSWRHDGRRRRNSGRRLGCGVTPVGPVRHVLTR
jgi:hypothetical protein